MAANFATSIGFRDDLNPFISSEAPSRTGFFVVGSDAGEYDLIGSRAGTRGTETLLGFGFGFGFGLEFLSNSDWRRDRERDRRERRNDLIAMADGNGGGEKWLGFYQEDCFLVLLF